MKEGEIEMRNEVKVIPVIQVRCVRGEGTKEDPSRVVHEYWSLDGLLLADDDKYDSADNYRPAHE